MAIGLAGYSLWRLFSAARGRGREHSESGLDRAAAFASGVVYAGLCGLAVEILAGSGGSSKTPAGVLGWPAGTWIVGIAGAALVAVGLYQGYRAVSTDFLEDSKTENMSPTVRRCVTWIGIVGHLARMVAFGLVGIFLIKAAVEYDPNNAVGLDGALAKLARASYGPYLLAVVAVGLIAFGVYSLCDARYRRI